MELPISLITGWNEDRPVFKIIKNTYPPSLVHFDNTLNNKLLATQDSACGNLHAGKGNSRVIFNGAELPANNDQNLLEITDAHLHLLKSKVLISAGHYMPYKRNQELVNSNSYKLLCNGIAMLKKTIEAGAAADLLITINDVTISGEDNNAADAPTMSSDERKAYYEHFKLPNAYLKAIMDLNAETGHSFSVYVIGENKLAERLNKMAGKLTQQGAFTQIHKPNGYKLNFDSKELVELAHNQYNADAFFISNEAGVPGKPKCVRACAKLAALPYEMNYTGFIQYLPVCSRNALEGFLIGNKIFSQQYGHSIPYISIHHTRSCF